MLKKNFVQKEKFVIFYATPFLPGHYAAIWLTLSYTTYQAVLNTRIFGMQ